MKDFYRQYDEWHLEPLRRDLPDYVYYRNYVRGHRALGGKPAITRLREQTQVVSLDVLDRLESYAWYEVSRTTIRPDGTVRMFGRKGYVGKEFAGVKVTLVETLEGLEARVAGQGVAILPHYRDMRQLCSWEWDELPPVLHFEAQERTNCPRIAVA